MIIKVLDPIDCEVVRSTGAERVWLRRLLSYPTVHYRPGQFKKIRSEHRHPLLVNMAAENRPHRWCFPTGFLPRVGAAAERDGMEFSCAALGMRKLEPTAPLTIKGVKFRDDQERLIEAAVTAQRGILKAPTGSGKTHILMGLLSRFPDAMALVVTHSLDIVSQTERVLWDHGFKGIMVASRQSIVESYKVDIEGKTKKRMRIKEKWITLVRELDILVIDEVHLYGDMNGQYTCILRNTLAPMRIGLTATTPKENTKVAMCLEGMVGPVVGEVTFEEGRELEIISEVDLQLIPVRVLSAHKNITPYLEMKRVCLEENRARNRLIITKAKELVEGGCTTLIFINALAHGDVLMEMAELFGLEAVFVEGLTDAVMRAKIKEQFNEGEVGCVISSKVWKEGVNIPNLGAVILAGGGKSELSTLQAIGRALRRTSNKKRAVVVDFLDPGKWLAEHTVLRLQTYSKIGWL